MLSNPSDLLADFQIVMGVHSNPWMQQMNAMNRFEEASRKYERVQEKYGNVKLTGHSLSAHQVLWQITSVVVDPTHWAHLLVVFRLV